jgi:hypothetical protein
MASMIFSSDIFLSRKPNRPYAINKGYSCVCEWERERVTKKKKTTWTIPENDRLHPRERDNGTIATDITTRSALQSARAKASIATTFTLSEVINSAKLGACTTLSSGNAPSEASSEETLNWKERRSRSSEEPCRSPVLRTELVKETFLKQSLRCNPTKREEMVLVFWKAVR